MYHIVIFLMVVVVSFADHSTDHSDEHKLELVQVLYRHGDRNPIDPFPTFDHKDESNWPEGFAQLTKKGKMQQYKLGQYLRSRYKDFLNESYSPYEIYVKSSSVDRCLMSAEANLAGLYPPLDDVSRWNPDIPWQPIPIHGEPITGDRYLHMDAKCARYTELNEDFLKNSDVMKKFREDYGNVLSLLSNKTGRNIQNPEDVDFVYDALFIQFNHFGTWPDWAPEGSDTLKAMRRITAFSFQSICYTPEMQMLKGGPLLKELVTNFNEKKSGVMDKRRKLFMYSGHDTTVAVILHTMGVFDPQIPPYATMVMLELHRMEQPVLNGSYHVKILLRNETDRDPYVLTVPNCGDPCTLENFNELMKPNIPDNWDSACETHSNYRFYDTVGFSIGIMVLLSLILFIAVLASVCFGFIRNRKNNPKPPAYPYLHLQMEDEDT